MIEALGRLAHWRFSVDYDSAYWCNHCNQALTDAEGRPVIALTVAELLGELARHAPECTGADVP